MKGKDEVGSSILTGLLMFKAGGLRIMLSK